MTEDSNRKGKKGSNLTSFDQPTGLTVLDSVNTSWENSNLSVTTTASRQTVE